MIYSWQARSSAGELRTGTLEAATPQAAADALSSSGLVPVRIEAVGAGAQQKEKLSLWKRLSSVGTVSLRRKALFYRQFAAVVEAGISLDNALSDLAEGETYRPLSCRIEAVRRHVAAGEALHVALAAGHLAGAMEQALSQLWDKKHGILRLLTPPFKGNEPGYIGAYPPGIRENGGQYTHAACWAVIALAHLGLSEEAWSIFRMLMPYSHSDTPEKAALYRVEPYVMAGDIAGEAPHTGRGGWTWYTGAASWMLEAAYRALLGLSIRRNTATLSPLLPRDWDEACVMIHTGGSRYTLVASRLCGHPELDGQPASAIPLLDDGREHTARFPLRAEAQDNPSI